MTGQAIRPRAKVFQTFCHINEYVEEGFANLHRMIAISDPLVLWAPSSQLLQSPQCRVGEDEFLGYLTAGRIRIVGRRDWLTSPNQRDETARRWPGARWDTHVDGTIAAIAKEDENLPDDEKRVLIAPDERGNSYAARYLEQNPEDVRRLVTELQGADARDLLPKGLLNSLRAGAGDPRALVTRLLRDVFNHGEAIHLASAEAPFFLAPRESTFLRLLDASLHTGVSVPDPAATSGRRAPRGAEPPTVTLTTDDYATLTKEVFTILATLDQSRGNSLSGFVAGSGHESLGRWYRESCAQVQKLLPEYRSGALVRELQSKYESGSLDESLAEVFVTTLDGLSGTAGLALSLADWANQGIISGFGLAGLAVGLVGAGHGALRWLGYTKAGPQKQDWPFLYTFGRGPNRKQYRRLAQALDRLSA